MWHLGHKEDCMSTNWCFLTMVLERRLLRVPWTVRTSNKSVVKETSPEYSLEVLMVKLKRQYFGHLMQNADLLEKTLMLGEFEDRRRGWQRMKWLNDLIHSMDMILSLSKLKIMKDSKLWLAAVHGIVNSQTWLSDWTTTIANMPARTSIAREESQCLASKIQRTDYLFS